MTTSAKLILSAVFAASVFATLYLMHAEPEPFPVHLATFLAKFITKWCGVLFFGATALVFVLGAANLVRK